MKLLLIVALVILTGCAAPNRGPWTKEGGTQAEAVATNAQCDYETAAATQGTDPGMRTIFGQEMERAIRKNDLMKLCLTAKGYRP